MLAVAFIQVGTVRLLADGFREFRVVRCVLEASRFMQILTLREYCLLDL